MTKRTIARKLLLAGGALCLIAGAAQAKIVDVTFTGVVADDDSIDVDGNFGDAGADLAGAAFTTHYSFDTSLGAIDHEPSVSDDIQGGVDSAAIGPGPLLSASITINGHSVSVPGLYFNEIYSRYDDSPQFYVEAADDEYDYDLYNYLEPPTGTPAGGYATPDFGDFDGDISGVGGDGYYFTPSAGLHLTGQHLTISSEAAAVPEPASWALILSGFGLIGGVLRGRRSVGVSFG